MLMRCVVVVAVAIATAACQGQPPDDADKDTPITAMASGAMSPSQAAEEKASEAYEAVPMYRIGVDDLLLVSVWGNKQLTVTVPVRPDGRISVPLIGDVVAGGKTPEAVSELIEKKLDPYIRGPKVSVILTELRSHAFVSRVRVTGAVEQPQSVPYRQGMTVLDLVLLAGGLNDFASPGRAKLYRSSREKGGSPEIRKIELDDILFRGKLKTNLELLPGDILTVPERLF